MNSPQIRCLLIGLVCLLLAVTVDAQETPPRIVAISDAMRQQIDKHEIAGAVTLVASRDRVLHLDAIGDANIEKKLPMQADSLFWIASMTKPITATAVMMLVEEGKLSVDDPIDKYIPELAHLKTADGQEHVITLKHLFTHSSGMPDAGPGELRTPQNLEQVMKHYVGKTLLFAPGSQWKYSQTGINTLGRIVEVVSGKPFQEFLQERLFTPLGMKDTTFYLTKDQIPRLATAYKKTGDKLEPAEISMFSGQDLTSRNRYPAPNGGLFSTASDYGKFARMILNQGTLDGHQYLKPQTVTQMTTVQSGDLVTGFTPGNGWGLGWCVVRQPQGSSQMLSPGTHGHGGAYGTQAWIDPQKGLVYILMVQRANFANSDASDTRMAFQEAAARALAH
ncbi:MAG TPA: serine hydrolase domain-containing protein [Humisphaera sp.]|nr:serine hydrolase domain-containing protein [Humisphaera sp.]